MLWLLKQGLLIACGITTLFVVSTSTIVVCDRASQRLEREAQQVEADRVVRNERDLAVQDRDSERRARLAAEVEALGAKLELDTIRRNGVFFPVRPVAVPAADLIPPQRLPVPMVPPVAVPPPGELGIVLD